MAGKAYTVLMLGVPVTLTSSDSDGRLALHDQAQLRSAARHARLVLPGAIGEVIARELNAYADFGRRFHSDALIDRLAQEVLATRPPVRRGGP
jgi:hypothetical protein